MSIKGGSKHYKFGKIEPLELTESQDLGFHLGNVVKYAVRAKFYAGRSTIEVTNALDKAIWYCKRYKELYARKRPIRASKKVR